MSAPRLLAISDLHINHRGNLEALAALPDHGPDWLIVAGDVGDEPAHLEAAWQILLDRFARVLWVPGNHELWARQPGDPRGEARYQQLVDLCRATGVLTPEDPWTTWEGPGGPVTLALCFVGYDYSLRPPEIAIHEVLAWAREEGIYPRDLDWLHTDPHPHPADWCDARIVETEARLSALPPERPIVLVNHYPLRGEHIRIWRIPRYVPWCGTLRTADWHRRFPLHTVVSGHLHMRATDWLDGVRFEEVSLGYPRHWRQEKSVEGYLREILPAPRVLAPLSGTGGPIWHR